MAASSTSVESLLLSHINPHGPHHPIAKIGHRCLYPSSVFSVGFKLPLLSIVPCNINPQTRRCLTSWTNISTVNASFPSLDRNIHRSLINSPTVVAAVLPVPFASAEQDDDHDTEHSDRIDVENEKSSSDDKIEEIILNAAADEELQEAAVNWTQVIIMLMDSFKVYLSTVILAPEKSPQDVIKDIIVETFAYSSSSSSTDIDHHHLIKDASRIEDFDLGIPYGALLCLGGFLSFMLTGSISGIRFGVVLGGTLLALSISSLRSTTYAWKGRRDNQSSALQIAIMKLGQAAIACIIFLRHLGLLFQRPSFPNCFTALISGGMVVFYLYRINMLDGGQKKKSKLETWNNA